MPGGMPGVKGKPLDEPLVIPSPLKELLLVEIRCVSIGIFYQARELSLGVTVGEGWYYS